MLKTPKRKIILELPEELLTATKVAVDIEDTDRSKFIRGAIRRELERLGISHDTENRRSPARATA